MTEKNKGNKDDLDNKDGDFVPPKDGSWLPKKRVDEMVGNAKDAATTANNSLIQSQQEVARLQEQLKTKNQANEPTRYSREDLAVLVEKEQISQVQADQLWDKQLRAEFNSELDKRFETFGSASDAKTVIQNDMAAYIQVVPNISAKGTDERTKVEKEYNYLISIGEQHGNRTELLAVRNTFGPIAELRTSLDTLKMETHRETGGSDSGGGEGGKKDFSDTLTAREKQHYEGAIKMGLYKDWDAVKEEMKYANPSVRKANGAQV